MPRPYKLQIRPLKYLILLLQETQLLKEVFVFSHQGYETEPQAITNALTWDSYVIRPQMERTQSSHELEIG